MGQAIGDALPFAVGVAISPVPVIAIILMLLSARAGANSAGFLVGWIVGVAGAGTILLVLGAAGELSEGSSGNDSSAGIRLVAGVLLLVLARRNLKKRPKDGEAPELPAWLAKVDGITPVRALAFGVALSAINPKNLLLIVGGALAISQTGVAGTEQAVALAVFVVIAASTVAAPVVLYRALGDRAEHTLQGLRGWLEANNATVMAVLLLVLGVVLIGKGISGLSA